MGGLENMPIITLDPPSKIYGDQNTPASQDSVTNSIVELGHPHDEIHDGTHYVSSDVVTGVAASAFQLYLLTAPNTTKRIHMLITISSAPGVTITIYEGPTINANGTVMDKINNNRNSANTATLAVFKTPTIGANGTQIYIEEIGSGTAAGKFNGSTSQDRNETERILKQNTSYLISIQALSNSTDISTQFRWYEV